MLLFFVFPGFIEIKTSSCSSLAWFPVITSLPSFLALLSLKPCLNEPGLHAISIKWIDGLPRKKLLSQGNGGKPQPPWTNAETIALLSDLEATTLAFRFSKAVNYEMSSLLLKLKGIERNQHNHLPIPNQYDKEKEAGFFITKRKKESKYNCTNVQSRCSSFELKDSCSFWRRNCS